MSQSHCLLSRSDLTGLKRKCVQLRLGAIMVKYLVYTEFILVRLCRKLSAYGHTFKSIPGTNQALKFSKLKHRSQVFDWSETVTECTLTNEKTEI
jgi:hypothetical protein